MLRGRVILGVRLAGGRLIRLALVQVGGGGGGGGGRTELQDLPGQRGQQPSLCQVGTGAQRWDELLLRPLVIITSE